MVTLGTDEQRSPEADTIVGSAVESDPALGVRRGALGAFYAAQAESRRHQRKRQLTRMPLFVQHLERSKVAA